MTKYEDLPHAVGGLVPGHGDRLADKVAVISGAGSDGDFLGTGAAMACLFAAQGARVAALDIDAGRLENTLAIIDKFGGKAEAIVTDVSDEQALLRTVGGFAESARRLDVVINNAAATAVQRDITKDEVADWNRTFAINVTGPMLLSRIAYPHLRDSGGGSIINISSMAALRGMGTGAYAASKGALHSMTWDLAYAWAEAGIRVNCLVPGQLHTPMGTRSRLGGDHERERRRRSAPLGTEGTAWDIAWAALFLASDESRWITGAVIPVDAGATVTTVLPMLKRFA